MKSKLFNGTRKGIAFVVASAMVLVLLMPTNTYAKTEKYTRDYYSAYSGAYLATSTVEIEVSSLKTNLARTVITFDATSKSFITKPKKKVSGHVNKIKIKKTGLTGSLGVNTSGASGTVTVKTDSVFEMKTKASSTNKRAITTYNNTITKGVLGSYLTWFHPELTAMSITSTSYQSLEMGGESFSNQKSITSYWIG